MQGKPCELWAHVAADSTFTLVDNYVEGAEVNYLIEGLDLHPGNPPTTQPAVLINSGNVSISPRKTDWEAAANGCNNEMWTKLDSVAHHPSLPGWIDKCIHCDW